MSAPPPRTSDTTAGKMMMLEMPKNVTMTLNARRSCALVSLRRNDRPSRNSWSGRPVDIRRSWFPRIARRLAITARNVTPLIQKADATPR